jgi:transposase-like protein
MTYECPRFLRAGSDFPSSPGPCLGRAVRAGSFWRASDSRWIQRFVCLRCKRGFSSATRSVAFAQKRRRLNAEIERLYCSGVSQRRLSLLVRANRKTVVRKIRFLASRARVEQAHFLREAYPQGSRLQAVQFDDLETSEHTKCKPLSVALAVDPKTRKILSFQLSPMPAKGLLAKTAFEKYGPRRDERPRGWTRLFQELQGLVAPQNVVLLSDENPHYPRFLRRVLPAARHERVRSRRACVAGQGELKKIGWDPLFALNHTCAMMRANMNRLFRRTWCTTKNRQGLLDHLAIYASFHNRCLTPMPETPEEAAAG